MSTSLVLARIRSLGGTVINSVPKYRAIRARLPLSAVETLATLDAVKSIRPADEAVHARAGTVVLIRRRCCRSECRREGPHGQHV